MELILVITVFCFSLSLLQSPCVSLDVIQVQPSLQKAADEVPLSLSTLPRKLRVTAEVTVKGHGDRETVSDDKQKDVAPGKQYKKEAKVVHGSKGTWQEWVEGTDTSEYFTMDYSHVKRRRPIHNKSLPVGP